MGKLRLRMGQRKLQDRDAEAGDDGGHEKALDVALVVVDFTQTRLSGVRFAVAIGGGTKSAEGRAHTLPRTTSLMVA